VKVWVGIHDFNFLQDFLKCFFQDKKTNYLLWNIIFISISTSLGAKVILQSSPKLGEGGHPQKTKVESI